MKAALVTPPPIPERKRAADPTAAATVFSPGRTLVKVPVPAVLPTPAFQYDKASLSSTSAAKSSSPSYAQPHGQSWSQSQHISPSSRLSSTLAVGPGASAQLRIPRSREPDVLDAAGAEVEKLRAYAGALEYHHSVGSVKR